jgi:hypothetical protein
MVRGRREYRYGSIRVDVRQIELGFVLGHDIGGSIKEIFSAEPAGGRRVTIDLLHHITEAKISVGCWAIIGLFLERRSKRWIGKIAER